LDNEKLVTRSPQKEEIRHSDLFFQQKGLANLLILRALLIMVAFCQVG
jgi:hypothetical protein